MRARIKAAWPGARVAAPAFPVRCTPGDNLAVHVAVAEAPAGSVLVVDVGHRARARLLGRGAHHRRAGARHRRARHRRWCARRRSVGTPRVPGVQRADRVAAARRRRCRARSARARTSVTSTWRRATGSSATATVWSSCPAARSTPCSPRDAPAPRRSRRMFEALRAGQTTVELLDLDPSPITRA